MKKHLAVVAGGDLRQIHLANLLSRERPVAVFGFEQNAQFHDTVTWLPTLEEAAPWLEQAEYVILPMPVSDSEQWLNAPFSVQKIPLQSLVDCMSPQTTVLGGKITPGFQQMLGRKNISWEDYLLREDLAVMNAVPTGEGTLQIILEEMPITIHGMKVLLIGSGRLCKVLRRQLTALGAQVSVCARNSRDLSWISWENCTPVPLKELEQQIQNYSVIINTVPACILDEKILRRVMPDSLLIDLASKPGGIDFTTAKQLGLRTIWALSLPGKTAPLSAGEILYRSLKNLFAEHQERNELHG